MHREAFLVVFFFVISKGNNSNNNAVPLLMGQIHTHIDGVVIEIDISFSLNTVLNSNA